MNTLNIAGWITGCSDCNWVDYHGMWLKKAKDGSWYVLRWNNLVDAMGEQGAKEYGAQYECSVYRVNLFELSEDKINSALESCGWEIEGDHIVSDYDGGVVSGPDYFEPCLVETLVSYGLGAPLESFSGNVRPLSVRAKARRFAMACMKDAALLAKQLSRPVNAIGSTAEEYGRGDIESALWRDPTSPRNELLIKMGVR